MARRKKAGQRPRVGLVLGAGSARGIAHIGVLQVLAEAGITFDLLVGSSMGALIGAIYGAGANLYLLQKLFEELNFNRLMDFQLPGSGFVGGRKIRDFTYLLTKGKRFEELSVPLAVVATDIRAGKRVVLTSGLVSEAVRASISIPGVFTPVEMGDMLLVDGAVSDRLPIELARELGCQRVVAVDVNFGMERETELKNPLQVLLAAIDLLERRIFVDLVKPGADILVQPMLGHIGSGSFERAAECVRLGREATLAALPQIRAACGMD
ncbi:MAG: patatin-like phospholipase family protein [Syntrophomonadaceae bacterium]|jgi:NTE family protein|nr:patatin-like phospholipase family protein [Syntrophomonadaceae bacterium]